MSDYFTRYYEGVLEQLHMYLITVLRTNRIADVNLEAAIARVESELLMVICIQRGIPLPYTFTTNPFVSHHQQHHGYGFGEYNPPQFSPTSIPDSPESPDNSDAE